jgi:hypothetical protein
MQPRDGCQGKKRHRNRVGAMIHISKLKEPGMRPYRCTQCQGWHIGHANRADGIQSRLDHLIGPDPRTSNFKL